MQETAWRGCLCVLCCLQDKLRAHAEAGFTTFDTADIYGPSEGAHSRAALQQGSRGNRAAQKAAAQHQRVKCQQSSSCKAQQQPQQQGSVATGTARE